MESFEGLIAIERATDDFQVDGVPNEKWFASFCKRRHGDQGYDLNRF
jgi:hypothetical protein